ncbi:replication initiation protein [Alkalihalobacillus oceani]|uniref:Replication initiation protein n=1 Tax=Halalkalibacter oceani TaxID=1653776 RepID=A0A9X2ISI4_9BACI|nr:replication initiation protein [Halalkalibacter oceani]MCM3716588.1 replication initiation protein [Halalkalibacter oceani]
MTLTKHSPNRNLVTKSNDLIEANYKLSVTEQKIILMLASYIQPEDDDFKVYTIRVQDFHRLLGLRGSPKYTELRTITKNLMKQVFEVRIDNQIIQVGWLSYVAYNTDEGSIDLRFDPFLKPYLLQLKREFTTYRLENVIKLDSAYSIRIYELLKQYERIGERTFTLKRLREHIGAENIYPAYGNFKQRVLSRAQKELREKTDLSFEFEERKKGRSVQEIRFFIRSLSDVGGTNDEKREDIIRMSKEAGFLPSQSILKKWLSYPLAEIKEAIDTVKVKDNIRNPANYITSILNAAESKEHARLVDTKSIDKVYQAVYDEIKLLRKRNSRVVPKLLITERIEEVLNKYLEPEVAQEVYNQNIDKWIKECKS